MPLANKNKYLSGLTLMEIIISTIILAVTLAGMTSLFVSSKKWLIHSHSKMAGAEIGRVFLNPLHMYVRQDSWGDSDNALSLQGTRYCDQAHPSLQMPGDFCQHLQAETIIPGTPFEAKYDLDTVSATALRKVRVTVRWTEKGP